MNEATGAVLVNSIFASYRQVSAASVGSYRLQVSPYSEKVGTTACM